VVAFLGTRDDIARPHLVRSVGDAAPRAEIWETAVKAGHMGLVVGSTAARDTWPTVAAWTRWRENEGPRPALVVPLGHKTSRGPEISPDEMETFDPGVDPVFLTDQLTWPRQDRVRAQVADARDLSEHRVERRVAVASARVLWRAVRSGLVDAATHGSSSLHAVGGMLSRPRRSPSCADPTQRGFGAREQRVIDALATGGSTEELVGRAYADTPAVLWPIAQRSLLAHLVKLQREGRAREEDGRWSL
jgi:hypothetical protein